MAATAFDTHRVVKRLREAGFNEAQAETFTDVLNESRAFDLTELATKADLVELRTELKAEIAASRTEFKGEMAALRLEIERAKTDILKWIVPLILAQIAVMIGLLAKLL